MDPYTVFYVGSDFLGTLYRTTPLPPPYLPGLNHERRALTPDERFDAEVEVMGATVKCWLAGEVPTTMPGALS